MTGPLNNMLFAPSAIKKVNGSLKKCVDAFWVKVKVLFNTEVWGSVFAPTYWQILVDENEKKLLPLSLS
jgi:hypothetical protein